MYLKSIEVQGFKSFANKIKFDFHNGITGIVGPNGSGKSNVADAVRWVLGEQRVKQLRGGTMQDVIFSGTENRKPLSYASVAITLDNADHQLPVDYEEVTVTRKLYRSGESEYLINGASCRLKDINEMFYDTGIGKEGYSIIGQGQIDKILSGKPEERRELFDEAAGIVKFNGDMGVITEINEYTETMEVEFDDSRKVKYGFDMVEELELAYAITVHKSQGSEYPAVIIPLLPGPKLLYNRNLLYTAVTRAKKCLTIVGSETVFQEMIQNKNEQVRYTSLAEYIREF